METTTKVFERKPKAAINNRIPGSKASAFEFKSFRVDKVNNEKETAHITVFHEAHEEKCWLSVPAAMVHSPSQKIFLQEGTGFILNENLLVSHNISESGEKWVFTAPATPVTAPVVEPNPEIVKVGEPV